MADALHIPLSFWFNSNTGLALPLISIHPSTSTSTSIYNYNLNTYRIYENISIIYKKINTQKQTQRQQQNTSIRDIYIQFIYSYVGL